MLYKFYIFRYIYINYMSEEVNLLTKYPNRNIKKISVKLLQLIKKTNLSVPYAPLSNHSHLILFLLDTINLILMLTPEMFA